MILEIDDINAVTVGRLMDELIYANYAHNRQHSPDITPTRWKKVFGEAVDRMENRYQKAIQ